VHAVNDSPDRFISALRDKSIELYQTRRLAEAEQTCMQILAQDPRNFDALLMLGALAAEADKLPRAAEYFERAIGVNDAIAHAHHNLGVVLSDLRRLTDALASFDRAIALWPQFTEAHCNRGAALEQLGRVDEAISSYEVAIALEPRMARAHRNRGSALQWCGRVAEALQSYDIAIAVEPGFAPAYCRRAAILLELSRPADALASCDHAIALNPKLAEAHVVRATVLRHCSRLEEALAACERAAEQSDSAELRTTCGATLYDLGRHEEALEQCLKALSLDRNYAHAYWHSGLCLRRLGRWEQALVAWDRTIALQPGSAAAHINRGLVLYELGRCDEALRDYQKAMTIAPGNVEAPWNASWCLLKMGRFDEGWEQFEWRNKLARPSATRQLTRPRWTGSEELADHTVLVHHEQGLGDTILFCRYVQLLSSLRARVVLEVPDSLKGLLRSLAGVTRLIALGDSLPEHDYHCPIMSLPWAFKTNLSTIPASVPYLRADPQKVLHWKYKLGPKRMPRVGLVWSSGLRPENPELWPYERRNIPLAKLAPLRQSEVEFYSIQKGRIAESQLVQALADNWAGPPIINCADQLNDFADTAALIENLDLVISVDTAVAHLAGALGKPVWILLSFDACWRWLMARSDSPWYPTAKLYRQESAGDWSNVIQKVCADLTHLNSLAARGDC
jgi:tetratricopeptide (TPR) repeat protein